MTVDLMKRLMNEISSVRDEVGGIILTGIPCRHFSAGADLRSTNDVPGRTRGRAALIELLLAIVDCEKPVVAAVNGAAVGAGAMLALISDQIVASEGAFFSFPEIDVGLPTPLALAVLSALSSGALAHELTLSGRRMSGGDARNYGLVGEVCPLGDLEERALSRCLSLAKKPAYAFAANKSFSRRRVRREIVQAGEFAQMSATRTLAVSGTSNG
jgi:enoyl-CoA hydratase/carnithine racemase